MDHKRRFSKISVPQKLIQTPSDVLNNWLGAQLGGLSGKSQWLVGGARQLSGKISGGAVQIDQLVYTPKKPLTPIFWFTSFTIFSKIEVYYHLTGVSAFLQMVLNFHFQGM